MQFLYREGLVIRAATGRYHVARLSRADVDSIYAVRASLEGLAAHLACERASDHDIDALEEILQREKHAAERHDSAGLLETGTAFHEWVITHAGNPVLSELVQTLRGRTLPFTVESSRLRSRETDAIREHELLIEILRRRDASAARKMMERHLEQSRLRLLDALEHAKTTVTEHSSIRGG
jgi:DNA-binding GntR family transcriptional regulator